jgi:hypothetical protein
VVISITEHKNIELYELLNLNEVNITLFYIKHTDTICSLVVQGSTLLNLLHQLLNHYTLDGQICF